MMARELHTGCLHMELLREALRRQVGRLLLEAALRKHPLIIDIAKGSTVTITAPTG